MSESPLCDLVLEVLGKAGPRVMEGVNECARSMGAGGDSVSITLVSVGRNDSCDSVISGSGPDVRRIRAGILVRMDVMRAVNWSSILSGGLSGIFVVFKCLLDGLWTPLRSDRELLLFGSVRAGLSNRDTASISDIGWSGVPEREGGEEVNVKSDILLKNACRRFDARIDGERSWSMEGVPVRDDGVLRSLCADCDPAFS